MDIEKKSISRDYSFVHSIIECIKNNKGMAANLRGADNPATEYKSWEFLAAFNIELDKSYQRLPFAMIAAAMARGKINKNGSTGIGEALARCYKNGSNDDQAKAKLRRLIACDSVEEVCRILRPILSLIRSRSSVELNFTRLLKDLRYFHWDSQHVKSGWAQNFYDSDKKPIKEA